MLSTTSGCKWWLRDGESSLALGALSPPLWQTLMLSLAAGRTGWGTLLCGWALS